jgi:hypothetical protein
MTPPAAIQRTLPLAALDLVEAVFNQVQRRKNIPVVETQ